MPGSAAAGSRSAVALTSLRFLSAAALLIPLGSTAQGQLPEGVRWPVVNGASPRLQIVVPQLASVTVGTADGPDPTLLAGVVGAARLPDGSLAIGDAGNNRVLFFDKNARYVKTAGRSGAGPGEYRQPLWFGRCANGNFAYHDGNQSRVSFLSPDGAYRGAVPLPAGIHFDPIVWCSGRGSFFFLYNRARDPVRKGEIERVPAALVHVTAGRADTLWKGGIQEYYVGKTAPAYFPVPFGEAALAAGAGNRIYACANLTARCTVFDSGGATLREFTINVTPQRPSPEAWDRAREELVTSLPTKTLRDLGVKVLNELPPRRNAYPLIDKVTGDRRGNLWARTLDNYATGWATWLVVSERGSIVAAVAAPRRFHPLEIDSEYIVGLTRDIDGVERVEVRTLRPFDR